MKEPIRLNKKEVITIDYKEVIVMIIMFAIFFALLGIIFKDPVQIRSVI